MTLKNKIVLFVRLKTADLSNRNINEFICQIIYRDFLFWPWSILHWHHNIYTNYQSFMKTLTLVGDLFVDHSLNGVNGFIRLKTF